MLRQLLVSVFIISLASYIFNFYVPFCKLIGTLFLQLKGTKRTATTAGLPPAAVAERGKGGAETGIDAAETAVGTVRSADTDAGEYLLHHSDP